MAVIVHISHIGLDTKVAKEQVIEL